MTVNLAYEASIDIAASPKAVYEMVSDLTRMGEWSPENTGGKWLDGTPCQQGSTFIGTNRMEGMEGMNPHEWDSSCAIAVADPGTCFEFLVSDMEGGGPYTRWTFRMGDNGSGGTNLSEALEVVNMPPAMAEAGDKMLQARKDMLATSIDTTLAAIKASAEN